MSNATPASSQSEKSISDDALRQQKLGTRPLRKAEKPLVVWFRLYGAEKRAMQAVAGKRRGAHNAVALAGTMAEIARLEAAALPVTPAELKAIASFKRVTGESSITPTLSAAMRDSVVRSKSTVQHAA